MKVNMKVESLAFWSILVFALIGFIFVIVIVHEMSHQQDFHAYVDDDSICILVWPENLSNIRDLRNFSKEPLGLYSFTYNVSNQEDIQKIEEYTEWKAYGINFIMIVIFFAAITLVIFRRIFGSRNEEYLNKQSLNKKLDEDGRNQF